MKARFVGISHPKFRGYGFVVEDQSEPLSEKVLFPGLGKKGFFEIVFLLVGIDWQEIAVYRESHVVGEIGYTEEDWQNAKDDEDYLREHGL